jgi:hypothetical protein
MRTTTILDDNLATRLRAEARRAGRQFRDVVNETLRRGLASRRPASSRENFQVECRDLGNLRPRLSLDNVAERIDRVQGSLHR